MGMNVRLDGQVAVLSNFGRLMNDPRHFDAARDLHALLDEGTRAFVIDLSTLRTIGDAALGLLMTLTRLARQAGAEVVLANATPGVKTYLDEMRLDDYWDVFDDVDEAVRSFAPEPD